MRTRRLEAPLAAAVAMVAICCSAAATAANGFGPRLGLTGDPDQVHFGLHLPTLSLAPNFGFMASFEAGVGEDITLFSGNMDFKYVFRTRAGSWRPYAGGGPALHFLNRDNTDDSMEVGMGVFGGMQTPTSSGAFFGEVRLGLVDSPDIKFTVGWMFR